MTEKIYAGHARIVNTQYGDMTKISLHKDDINKIVKYMKENDSDWINLDVKEKREKVEGKATHYLEVDQWKPSQQNNTPPPPEEESDDLPF
jgi:hypothetical protein